MCDTSRQSWIFIDGPRTFHRVIMILNNFCDDEDEVMCISSGCPYLKRAPFCKGRGGRKGEYYLSVIEWGWLLKIRGQIRNNIDISRVSYRSLPCWLLDEKVVKKVGSNLNIFVCFFSLLKGKLAIIILPNINLLAFSKHFCKVEALTMCFRYFVSTLVHDSYASLCIQSISCWGEKLYIYI